MNCCVGAPNQMLRDLQDQTRMLRAQIGNLSQQNQELRQKYSSADLALSQAEDSKAHLEIELQDIQGQLQRSEVGLAVRTHPAFQL